METFIEIAPWVISVNTMLSMYLLGNKRPKGWAITLLNQVLWLVWILATSSWGLIPLNTYMWIISIRNYRKWRKEQ